MTVNDGEMMTQTAHKILCDASSLISLTDAGLLGALITLSHRMRNGLYVTPTVVDEAITRPLENKEYAFSAVRLKRALLENVFTIINAPETLTEEILNISNSIFLIRGRPLRLVHRGEAEMLAAAIDNKIENVLMDERTTRTLIEAPNELRAHLIDEFKTSVAIDNSALAELKELTKDISIIRSSEVIAVAYEKNYFKKFKELEKKAFEAALYSIKFNGCAISFEEIEEIVRELH
jgi:predicted nucleic acid-binding protein